MVSIMKYKIVYGDNFISVEKDIEKLLKHGWRLHGSLNVVVLKEGIEELVIFQVMVF